jgi:hypothetical protein
MREDMLVTFVHPIKVAQCNTGLFCRFINITEASNDLHSCSRTQLLTGHKISTNIPADPSLSKKRTVFIKGVCNLLSKALPVTSVVMRRRSGQDSVFGFVAMA